MTESNKKEDESSSSSSGMATPELSQSANNSSSSDILTPNELSSDDSWSIVSSSGESVGYNDVVSSEDDDNDHTQSTIDSNSIVDVVEAFNTPSKSTNDGENSISTLKELNESSTTFSIPRISVSQQPVNKLTGATTASTTTIKFEPKRQTSSKWGPKIKTDGTNSKNDKIIDFCNFNFLNPKNVWYLVIVAAGLLYYLTTSASTQSDKDIEICNSIKFRLFESFEDCLLDKDRNLKYCLGTYLDNCLSENSKLLASNNIKNCNLYNKDKLDKLLCNKKELQGNQFDQLTQRASESFRSMFNVLSEHTSKSMDSISKLSIDFNDSTFVKRLKSESASKLDSYKKVVNENGIKLVEKWNKEKPIEKLGMLTKKSTHELNELSKKSFDEASKLSRKSFDEVCDFSKKNYKLLAEKWEKEKPIERISSVFQKKFKQLNKYSQKSFKELNRISEKSLKDLSRVSQENYESLAKKWQKEKPMEKVEELADKGVSTLKKLSSTSYHLFSRLWV